ncbi:hypothetical protein BOTBODRAFT_169429 [Botryobasidium botryosum FD-172 SS1]|uniref:Serine/threonine-protein kinase RIO1 n=1 Tax=Botryobasidium botryosum (strain FD-172 SS1) TaxID=930990 RepID=A0A067N177_BOTB1|nr:hypothetical protein BOTBODRAFT_169429 [Botryobasidium botryosum FD-172 SS1]
MSTNLHGELVSALGQFDDAPSALAEAKPYDPREGQNFIDEDSALDWSEDEDEDEDEDELWEDGELGGVNDEDWEMADRDFTKQYNRLRQHVAVRSGTATGSAPTIHSHGSSVAPLPAVNRGYLASKSRTNGSAPTSSNRVPEDRHAALAKYASRIANIEMPYVGSGMGVGVNRKGAAERANAKDKSDRATSDQVLDPRTRIILFKMIGRGLISEVNGCVSTGKEANVYHARGCERPHLAIKVYKTSILIFKDRDRYVTGEYRFRHGYSRRNPRKMVKLWAEKEMRNLKRLSSAGIRCPEPIEVRENVLVMEFLGDKEGWASPRLKDASIPADHTSDLYTEIIIAMRKLYWVCKLVHADLSEYNILYHESHLYIIDVSQSVEHDHPSAFDFLRSDIKNIDEFWARRGVSTMGLRRTFEFITTEDVGAAKVGADDETDDLRRILLEWIAKAQVEKTHAVDVTESVSEVSQSAEPIEENRDQRQRDEAAQEDAVFLRSYIPRTLNEVYDPERDIDRLARGEGKDLIYAGVTGIAQVHEDNGGQGEEVVPQKKAVKFENDEGTSGDEDEEVGSEGEDEEGGDEGGGFEERKPRGHRHEDKEAKKERKKAAKEEAREKRKNKIPKAEKKRRIKVTSSK